MSRRLPFWELPIPPLTGRQEIPDQVDTFRKMGRAAVKANETTLLTGRPDQIHDVRGNASHEVLGLIEVGVAIVD